MPPGFLCVPSARRRLRHLFRHLGLRILRGPSPPPLRDRCAKAGTYKPRHLTARRGICRPVFRGAQSPLLAGPRIGRPHNSVKRFDDQVQNRLMRPFPYRRLSGTQGRRRTNFSLLGRTSTDSRPSQILNPDSMNCSPGTLLTKQMSSRRTSRHWREKCLTKLSVKY